MSNILIVLTTHDSLGDTGRRTGYWLEELAAPYYLLTERGHHLTIATLTGARPPYDPASAEPPYDTEETHRLVADKAAQDLIGQARPLADMDPDDFDAVFYPGGHGIVWDLAHSPESAALIEAFARAGKPTAFVCHAPSVLRDVRTAEGRPFVEGRRVTGFSNAEEEAVGLTDVMPFLLEDALKERGADYSAAPEWTSHVVTDGTLITGQNPSSSVEIARALDDALALDAVKS
ncbi:type 1 glutamine amidotransferase domain-containing protein [Brevibacterium oceani]|uniref:type 1 glutamine amidotransferase domain-containing protein n=1 Tax=Brevibacterium oceani TaxID=358099 RepID=UPI001B331DA9|nr:type 1 glutamine amidotransferase domain-containing protein [Brevibacterium oceani]